MVEQARNSGGNDSTFMLTVSLVYYIHPSVISEFCYPNSLGLMYPSGHAFMCHSHAVTAHVFHVVTTLRPGPILPA